MNREIKFRALKDDMSNCNFVYGNLIYNDDTPRITNDSGETFHTCLKQTEGQYTGLTDRNGVEIFEGDWIKCVHTEGIAWEKTYTDIGVVEFTNRGSFAVKCPKKGYEKSKDISKRYFFLSFNPDKDFEVIGNVHQHPDML